MANIYYWTLHQIYVIFYLSLLKWLPHLFSISKSILTYQIKIFKYPHFLRRKNLSLLKWLPHLFSISKSIHTYKFKNFIYLHFVKISEDKKNY